MARARLEFIGGPIEAPAAHASSGWLAIAGGLVLEEIHFAWLSLARHIPARRLLAGLIFGGLLSLPSAALAQEGGVEGTVLIDGRPADDVVVYLDPDGLAGDHTSRPDTTVIDQRQLRFLPPVVVGRLGMTVDFLNSDPILHNVFSPGWSGEAFDLGTYPSDSSRSHTFTEPGPHVILCHVHPEMVAYVIVVTSPYYGVTDSEGRFLIPEVPEGSYGVNAWRRGSDLRSAALVVSAGGARGLVLDLSEPDRLLEEAPR